MRSNLEQPPRRENNEQYDARALNIYRETIVAFRDVGQTGAVAHQLECFRSISLAWDQHERALKLIAAANVLREKGSTPMAPNKQIYFDGQLRILREKINDDDIKKGWENGHMMTIEQVIAFALDFIKGGQH